MSVKFLAVPRVNPRDLEAPKRFYAFLERGDDVTFEELIAFIGTLSGINEPYIVAVLRTLEKVIIDQLSHGRYVQLGRIGTLYLALRSNGTELSEELTARNVKSLNIRFKPGRVLRHAAKGFILQKAA